MDAPKGSDGLYFARPSRDCRRRSYEVAEYCWDGLWAVSFTCRILYRCKSLKTSQFVRKQCGIEVFYEEKKYFCNHIAYSLADAISHNLIFTQGVPCDLDMHFNME